MGKCSLEDKLPIRTLQEQKLGAKATLTHGLCTHCEGDLQTH